MRRTQSSASSTTQFLNAQPQDGQPYRAPDIFDTVDWLIKNKRPHTECRGTGQDLKWTKPTIKPPAPKCAAGHVCEPCRVAAEEAWQESLRQPSCSGCDGWGFELSETEKRMLAGKRK